MNDPSTVTYSTAEILKRIEDKLDKQSEKIGVIEVKLTAVETEVKNLKEDVRDIKNVQNTLVTEVSDLKGVKSFIIPIFVAVITAFITAFLTLIARLIPNIFH
ncbi:hypothetical protein [Crocosphaera chwakensis]|uniref:Shikimate 5-dehydrogenase n=1 Tax=Crocosphaera chwakensis CCY0110 TaxID=391612 RepID=A3ILA5_9CHRO|nr:hypothetical protein [Crocosphaera chwakensis]EAZ92974.1 hypothetical protein CY0110_22797 [Crocosphaera chwakensis CCY0110]